MGPTNLLARVKDIYSSINFQPGDDFRWSPTDQTVYVAALDTKCNQIMLLHEIGHAIAGHQRYDNDIELLTLEREAWVIARERVAPPLNLEISEELIEEALDSYRNWLHVRSLCPECNQNGIQRSMYTYTCLLCNTTWRVNDARKCGLKRYRLEPKTPA